MANDINLFKVKDSIFLEKIKSKSDLVKDEENDGYLIESNEKEARRIIESLKGSGKLIGVVGGDDAFNRRAIETLKINYLVSPEVGNKKNSLKQRDSGLNHVVAKEAREKNVSIVIDFGRIRKLGDFEKIAAIERIIQNVKICRKAGCELKIANFSKTSKEITDEKSRIAFGVNLGMSSVQAKNSVKF